MKNASLVCILIICCSWLTFLIPVEASAGKPSRIILESEGWHLVGDLLLPSSDQQVPAVLLLNKTADTRAVYEELANQLAKRGIASLRLDLRGHGESTNLGHFVPGDSRTLDFLWDSDADVITAHQYLKSHEGINAERIGIVGASYSGEEMAEAGRMNGYAKVYVALSPGSFSDESIQSIDPSGIPWLFIVSKNERHLKEIEIEIRKKTKTLEMLVLPGNEHATRILTARPDIAERIAVWMAMILLN